MRKLQKHPMWMEQNTSRAFMDCSRLSARVLVLTKALADKRPCQIGAARAFMGSTVFQAAVLALQAGELTVSERFFTHLTERLSSLEAAQLGQVAIDLNEPHIAVMIGKRAASGGVTIPAPYYAVHDLAKSTHPIATEFALAIARRESEFDPVVVSGAGARGLMQVMPATAQNVAGELGIDYAKEKADERLAL